MIYYGIGKGPKGENVIWISDDPKELNYSFQPSDELYDKLESEDIFELMEGIYGIMSDVTEEDLKEKLNRVGLRESPDLCNQD